MKRLSERQQHWIERTIGNNRNYKRLLYNRLFGCLLAVSAQMVTLIWLLYAIAYHSPWTIAVQVFLIVCEVVFVLYIISTHERPSSKLNWIIVILLFPVFGVPMYLTNGRGRPARKMKRKIASAKAHNKKIFNEVYGETPTAIQPRCQASCHYLSKYCDYPVFNSGEVAYYKMGKEMFADMLQELRKAEKFILLEYFIIANGKMWTEILSVLLEKAMEGVQIRIIYDDFGCMLTLPPQYERYLESLHENIRCMTFNPVVPFFALRMNHRDHRKILVIDGKVGFTGGVNIADEYIDEKKRFGYWKDTGIKLTGDCVQSLTRAFFYIWNAFRKDVEDLTFYLPPLSDSLKRSDVYIQPYDDSPLSGTSAGEMVYADLVQRAEKYVWIFTPYLILDEHMRTALCQAAMRGVDVRIVTPGIPDKKIVFRLTRANYHVLMKAGVRIYEYKPGFIHAKSMISDDCSAVVGTINLDYRSLCLHFENAVYFSGVDAVLDVKQDYQETFAVCKECTAENTKRGIFGRFIDAILRVFETLL